MTNYEREVAIALVEALVEYGLTSHLAQYGERCTETWFDDNRIETFGFGAASGATKSCFWHHDLSSWVIKVGHTENVSCDYATVEYDMYCKAEEEGFAAYFPKTVYLGEFGGRPFYAQEMAECNEDEITSEWYDRLRDRYDEDGEEYDCDRLWDEVYAMEDEERAYITFGDEALCAFLRRNGIGDLHEGNFGYIRGSLVIIDYSGYHG